MRDRVQKLREEREAERQREAEERKRHHFLVNSEPIRDLKRKQQLQQIVAQRDHQLKEKEVIKQHEQEGTT